MSLPFPDKSVPVLDQATGMMTQAWYDYLKFAPKPLPAAAQSDQETGTSNAVAVTPGMQKFHPSAAKAWVKFAGSGVNGAQTINASYNVSGVSRTALGTYVVTFTTAFSSANYAAVVTGFLSGTVITDQGFSQAAGSTGVFFGISSTGVGVDPTSGFLVAFGDL